MQNPENELDMLKVILDAFVDHPDNYSEAEKKTLYSKADLLSHAIKPNNKVTNRAEISNEWKAIVVAIGAITLSAIGAILIGSWKSK